MARKTPEDATLLDVLVDGFEKNESWYGFHWRELPMADEAAAIQKFAAFAEEATRWKGTAARNEETPSRRIAAWDDFEIRQMGRAIMVRVREPRFSGWWHEEATWEGNPMGPIHEWIKEELQTRP